MDEKSIAKQCYMMYRNRWKRKGPEAAARSGFNICIGWLESGGTTFVPETKKDEYRVYFNELAKTLS